MLIRKLKWRGYNPTQRRTTPVLISQPDKMENGKIVTSLISKRKRWIIISDKEARREFEEKIDTTSN